MLGCAGPGQGCGWEWGAPFLQGLPQYPVSPLPSGSRWAPTMTSSPPLASLSGPRCPPSPMSAPRELPRLAAAPAASTHSPPRGFRSLTCVCISGSRSTQHPSGRLPRAWGQAVGVRVDAHTHAHTQACGHVPSHPHCGPFALGPQTGGRGREGVGACLAAALAPRVGVFVGDGGYEFTQVSPRCCHCGWPCGEAPQVTKASLCLCAWSLLPHCCGPHGLWPVQGTSGNQTIELSWVGPLLPGSQNPSGRRG